MCGKYTVKPCAVWHEIIINIMKGYAVHKPITVTDAAEDMEMQSDGVIGHRDNRTSERG